MNKTKFVIVFLVMLTVFSGFLVITTGADTFGNTEAETSDYTFYSPTMVGYNATCTSNGTANAIYVRGKHASGTSNLKGILYNDSGDIIAVTDATTVNTTLLFWELPFSSPPSVVESTTYSIGIINNGEFTIKYQYYAAAPSVRVAAGIDYNNPPDPVTWAAFAYYNFSMYVDYTPSVGGNNAPVNNAAQIVDIDDTDNIYAQITDGYTMTVNVTDADGYADIDYVNVTLQTGTPATRVVFQFDEDTATFSAVSGDTTKYVLDVGSCSNVSSGNTLNMTFVFDVQWDATEEADLDIKVYTVDDEPESDTDTFDVNYDVVTNLVVSGFSCDDDRGDISQTITFTGTVYYANNPASSTATTFYPPDAEFTSIHVYDSGNTDKGNDTTIVNGAFSVAFSADATAGLETYNPYINMVDGNYTDAEETPTDTYISDSLTCTITIDDANINIGENASIAVTAVYDYDSAAYDGTLTLNHTTYTYATPTYKAYTVDSAGGDDTYGVTEIGTNDTGNVLWDGLNITSIASPVFLDNGDFSYLVRLASAYDDSAFSNGTVRVVHANGTEITTNFTANATGYATVVVGQANTTQAGTYTIIGNQDATYGITDMTENQTFVIRSWTLQARDKDSNNLPRSVVFTITGGGNAFDAWTSSTAGLSDTIYAPNATTYTVSTSWGSHTVKSSSIALSANTASTIDTKIASLYVDDDTHYALFSVNNIDLNTPTLQGEDGINIQSVDATGDYEFKADFANWKRTIEPESLSIGTSQYTSSDWTFTGSVLTVTNTFDGDLPHIELTFPSQSGGGGGGYTPPPDDGTGDDGTSDDGTTDDGTTPEETPEIPTEIILVGGVGIATLLLIRETQHKKSKNPQNTYKKHKDKRTKNPKWK